MTELPSVPFCTTKVCSSRTGSIESAKFKVLWGQAGSPVAWVHVDHISSFAVSIFHATVAFGICDIQRVGSLRAGHTFLVFVHFPNNATSEIDIKTQIFILYAWQLVDLVSVYTVRLKVCLISWSRFSFELEILEVVFSIITFKRSQTQNGKVFLQHIDTPCTVGVNNNQLILLIIELNNQFSIFYWLLTCEVWRSFC